MSQPVDPGLKADCDYFGPFCLNHRTRELWRNGELLTITPKAFDLLQVLVSHPDRVMEKTELMQKVWPDSFVGEDSLTHNIAVLRKVLGDSSESPQYIATIPRHGYRFVAPVRKGPTPEENATANAGTTTPAPVPFVAAERRSSVSRPWAISSRLALATVLVLCLLALAITYARRADPVLRSVSFAVYPPDGMRLASGGILSPDGTRLAFAAADASGVTRLWVRPLDSVEAFPLQGTEGAAQPFWSHDGSQLGFFANGMLMKIRADGGLPETLASLVTSPVGGTWSRNDVIVFAAYRTGIFMIPASGGTPTQITTLDADAQEATHHWPQFLPDGKRFLYGLRSADTARNGVYVGSVDSDLKLRVLETPGGAAVYAAGRIFYIRDGALRAQAFDPDSLQARGSPEPIASNVPAGLAFSAIDGGFAYLSPTPPRRQTWFSRAGEELGIIDTKPQLSTVALSPDEQQLAGVDYSSPTAGIWLYDLRRGTASRWTTIGDSPTWTPDGNAIMYMSSQASGVLDLYQKPAYGKDEPDLLLNTGRSVRPVDLTEDGKFLVYATEDPATKSDLWLLPLTGERKPIPYLVTPSNELQGRPSPNGRWMAYASDESGRWEVYLQSFPAAGGKRRVSVSGGVQPQWRKDGRELYYLSLDRTLMAVEINDRGTLEIGNPAPLFQTRTQGNLILTRNNYTVTKDGQRFLVDAEIAGRNQWITVVLSWPTDADE